MATKWISSESWSSTFININKVLFDQFFLMFHIPKCWVSIVFSDLVIYAVANIVFSIQRGGANEKWWNGQNKKNQCTHLERKVSTVDFSNFYIQHSYLSGLSSISHRHNVAERENLKRIYKFDPVQLVTNNQLWVDYLQQDKKKLATERIKSSVQSWSLDQLSIKLSDRSWRIEISWRWDVLDTPNLAASLTSLYLELLRGRPMTKKNTLYILCPMGPLQNQVERHILTHWDKLEMRRPRYT